MTNAILRPATSPQAYQRAQALLARAERRQHIMGLAMHQAETAQSQVAPTTSPPGGDVVQQVSQTAQANILAAHHSLAQAEHLANAMLANDTVMAACNAQAYGLAPVPVTQDPAQDPAPPKARQANDGNSDVIDVECRVVSTGTAPT